MSETESLSTDDIIEAVINSDDPLDAAMHIIIVLMALAGNLSTEEWVFKRIENLIRDARQRPQK